MPPILENEILLYAQAFAAVNHINFINPKAYKAECYVLKGHAIHKINAKLNDHDDAASDANIGAVLCMASAAHLEVRFPKIRSILRPMDEEIQPWYDSRFADC